jgi:dolichol-phosphate mannosyltransferase
LNQGIVIIPTYNECGNIAQVLHRVMALPTVFDVLVVDDNSPDGTAALVKALQVEYPQRIHLLERAEKNGLGTAYIAGFKRALTLDYNHIFEMDADLSHNPDDLCRLYEACTAGGADMSIGSRYTRGGRVSNWPLGRILISYFASIYARSVLWLSVTDTTAGFVCYRREVLEAINLGRIEFVGYAFQIEMKYAAHRRGFKIVEIPITFIDRQIGASKMNMGIFKEAFFGVLKMRFRKVQP